MGFIGRWLSDAICLAFALALGILAMQVPAVTRDYENGLLQVATAARRDLDQRMAAARDYYALAEPSDAALIEALRSREPANAQGLTVSLERIEVLEAAYRRIAGAPALARPLAALFDMVAHAHAAKSAILATALAGYERQLLLTADGAAFGVAGLVLGSFLAHLMIAGCAALPRWRRRRRASPGAAIRPRGLP